MPKLQRYKDTVYVGYKANKEIFADFGLITGICLIAKFGGLISDEIIREIAIFFVGLRVENWRYIRLALYPT